MVILTKLNGVEILVNENLIESAYETPDTVILMENGHTYIVQESLRDIQTKIAEFSRSCRRRFSGRAKENLPEG